MDYLSYWGKAGEGDEHHRLAHHALDAAAAALALLAADSLLAGRLAGLTGLPPASLAALIPFLVALHDLGKFAPWFQAKRDDLRWRLQGRQGRVAAVLGGHPALSLLVAHRVVEPLWLARGWFGLGRDGDVDAGRDWLRALAPAWAAHHGRPTASADHLRLKDHFPMADQAAMKEFLAALATLCGAERPLLAGWDPQAALAGTGLASWLLAGLVVAADWLASNPALFPWLGEPLPLAAYWPRAQELARRAVEESGLAPRRPAPALAPTELFPHLTVPTPLQAWAAEVAPPPGPQLYLLEDQTGAGKTEAALLLANRLLASGRAEGFFLALPTMATANAMFDRLADAYRRLFAPGERPSPVLAHSRRRLRQGFAGLELGAAPAGRTAASEEAEDAAAQCAAWLAESNKRALLANAGVGTLDQALLAALPVRHQALRLLGLGRSLLIADEVHAYDDYTGKVLEGLLKFHAALGGSAILLSATLPQGLRQRLVDAFRAGLGESSPAELTSSAYPLATRVVGGRAPEEIRLAPRPGPERSVAVRLLEEPDRVVERLLAAARAGACGLWVRNTVDDAQEAWRELAARLGADRVLLFHARFALADRLAREEAVVRRFGQAGSLAERAGWLLVASQVVEQSLDLDFDILSSDLAPMELVLQRAGRLHRHPRPGRPLASPELLVLAPPSKDDAGRDWYAALFPRARWVYRRPGRLWLTARELALRGELRLPEEARELVEAVYGAAEEEVPPALRKIEETAEGEASALRSVATWNCLNPWEGYGGGSANWEEDAPTRLGQPQSVLRLARWQGGRLAPWAEGRAACDPGLLWELSEVRVGAGRVAEEAPPADADLAAALASARQAMPDQGRRSLLIPLVPGEDGIWRGAARNGRGEPVALGYDEQMGLGFGVF